MMCKANKRAKRRFRKMFVKALGEAVMRYAEKCGAYESDIATPFLEEIKKRRADACEGGVCKVQGDFRLYRKAFKDKFPALETDESQAIETDA